MSSPGDKEPFWLWLRRAHSLDFRLRAVDNNVLLTTDPSLHSSLFKETLGQQPFKYMMRLIALGVGILTMGGLICIMIVTRFTTTLSYETPCNTSTSLSGDKKLTFCGDIVDIRVFQGKRPTHEGINLKSSEWRTLLTLNCPRVKNPACESPQPIGENIKLTVCDDRIDIRKYAGKPTIVGVTLKQNEWGVLLKKECK